MAKKPTYEELEQRVKELEKEAHDREQAEEGLHRSAKQASAAIEAARGFTFSYNIATGKIEWDGALEEITGYTPEEFANVDIDGWAERIHPDDRDRILSILQEAFKRDRATAEYRFRTKNGHYVTLSSISLTEKDEEGKTVRLMGILQDITEIKQAEEKLRTEKEKLNNIVEGIGAGLSLLDADTRIIWSNDILQQWFGPHEKIAGKYCYELYNLKNPQRECAALLTLSTDRIEQGEAFAYTINGEERYFQLVATPIRNEEGNIVQILELSLDITDRKQAEERIGQQTEFLNLVLESLTHPFYVIDASDYTVRLANSAANLGHLSKDITCYALTHKSDKPCGSPGHPCPLEKIKKTKQTVTVEHIHYDKDGNPRNIEVHAYPIFNKEGNVSQIIEYSLDITQSKRSEEALRESEEKYRIITENATDIIWEANLDGNTKFMSPSFESLTGYSVEESMAMTMRDMITPDSFDRIINVLGERLRTDKERRGRYYPPVFVEVEHYRKDGSTFWCEESAKFVRDKEGNPIGLTGVTRDITDRKKAEKALRESEEKYRTILENIEDGYYEVDIAGNLTFFNDALCKIRGCSRDELMGMNNRQFMSQENAKKAYKAFNRVYTTGKPEKGLEWETIRRDGTIRYEETSTSLIKDSEGQPIGFRGIVRDMTERKRAEEEKQSLEAQFQKAQRMEAIGTLASGMAHNFNNLLMAIQGNASVALMDIEPNHPFYQNLKDITKQVKSGSTLTRQLLGFARKGRYEVKPISLNQLVKETSNTFDGAKKEISVHQELSEGLYGIKADQGQIEQVLLNLYINAADAMSRGGDLFLKTMNITHEDMIDKAYNPKPGNYVLLIVRDTGIGMDKETMERIFDPFFTTKGLAQGTGLGLASTYGIIKSYGGYIDVESEMGKGTNFEIYLPATEEEVKEEKEVSGEIVRGKETILFVDDEDMVLITGERMLKKLGHEVLLAASGREALELFKKNRDRIDMVLLDMVMPDIGGGEIYDRMKEIDPRVKVLLSSGYSINGEATEILDRGCNGFIQKPFTMKEISQSIRKVLK